MFAALTLSNAELIKLSGKATIISSAPALVGGVIALAVGAMLRRGEENVVSSDNDDVIDGEVIIEHDSDEVQD